MKKFLMPIALFVLLAQALCAAPSIEQMLKTTLLPATPCLRQTIASFTSCGDKLDQKLEELKEIMYEPTAGLNEKIDFTAFLLWKILLRFDKPYQENELLILEAADVLPGNFYVEALWGNLLYKEKNYAEALQHLENALLEQDDHIDTLYKAGLASILTLQYERASEYLQKLLSMNIKEFAVYYYLGVCCSYLQELEEAVFNFESALESANNEQERQIAEDALRKAKEQLASTEGFTGDEIQHFVLNFAGESQNDLGDTTAEALEDIYYQVTSSLNFDPNQKINVTFYRSEDYYKLGSVRGWSAASASGINVMVPLSSGYKSESAVKGLLAHEFTHTIINMKTGSRCPLWLHEGIAQYHEFEAAYGSHDIIRPDFEGTMQNDFFDSQNSAKISEVNNLISSPNHKDVVKGYVASYLAVRCLTEQYGQDSLDTVLTTLGKGKTVDEAIEEATGLDMAGFQDEFECWLQNQ